MNIGDLVHYYPQMSSYAKKQEICVGLVIGKRTNHDWREPAYMVDWSTWPGEPSWYHPHNLKLIAAIDGNNEKTTLV